MSNAFISMAWRRRDIKHLSTLPDDSVLTTVLDAHAKKASIEPWVFLAKKKYRETRAALSHNVALQESPDRIRECKAVMIISSSPASPTAWFSAPSLQGQSLASASQDMPVDGGTVTVPTVLSAISGALTTTVRITEKVFEILAVGEQSRSLLATINQVNGQLDTARTLRRQRSSLLSASEKSNIDRTFVETDAALQHVAKLVERARVDQQVNGGKLGHNTRMLFVLKDSPNIMVSLTQLGIAAQQLNTTVIILYTLRATQPSSCNVTCNGNRVLERRPPPSYEESQLISSARLRNLRKRASIMADHANDVAVHEMPAEIRQSSLHEIPEMAFDRLSITSSLFDVPSRTPPSQPPTMGRARSRRWLETQSAQSS
nr:hypothetical protein B0A51_04501 [Rachicladosporium sp. CCFEE 5018]